MFPGKTAASALPVQPVPQAQLVQRGLPAQSGQQESPVLPVPEVTPARKESKGFRECPEKTALSALLAQLVQPAQPVPLVQLAPLEQLERRGLLER